MALPILRFMRHVAIGDANVDGDDASGGARGDSAAAAVVGASEGNGIGVGEGGAPSCDAATSHLLLHVSLDEELLRHFLTRLLGVVGPPYSVPFMSAMLSLLAAPACLRSLRRTLVTRDETPPEEAEAEAAAAAAAGASGVDMGMGMDIDMDASRAAPSSKAAAAKRGSGGGSRGGDPGGVALAARTQRLILEFLQFCKAIVKVRFVLGLVRRD